MDRESPPPGGVQPPRAAAGLYDGDWLTIDEVAWRENWNAHVEGARSYFTGEHASPRRKARFLEIDLAQNAGWGPLCNLLGRAEPVTPYPWMHRRDVPLDA
jgi:hypothetical protein